MRFLEIVHCDILVHTVKLPPASSIQILYRIKFSLYVCAKLQLWLKLYISSTISTQINILLLLILDQLNSQGSSENICNFSQVSYFWGFLFSYVHEENKYTIRVSGYSRSVTQAKFLFKTLRLVNRLYTVIHKTQKS